MTDRRSFIRTAVTAGGAVIVPSLAATAFVQPAIPAGERAGDERTIAGVRLCWCPAGRFQMGSPPAERGRRPDEAQVWVTLTRGFWMAKFEVTQGDWARVMGALPPRAPSVEFGLGDDVPVYWVSFTDAETFCRRLSGRDRTVTSAGWEFALPTEAQWEYACRAGSPAPYAFGAELTTQQANIKPKEGPSIGRAVRVGSYPPNTWGIHDMHGNIFEWCRDWYHASLPGGTDPDLSGSPGVRNRDGTYSRVRRGGAWNDDPSWCRSAQRLRYEPGRASDHIGFRVALVPRADTARHPASHHAERG